ncbi:serine/threonine-protein kinase [Sporosarcina sp. USHLN248]|uniref:serine/threonine-protein kinase n=1 Tax=Sporosarcina sp. USHLN248 TaxID=3081300 RepID=UPI0030159734
MANLIEFCRERFKDLNAIEKLSSGGQKEVFVGVHNKYGKVALKLIELHNESNIKRALRELDISSKLNGEEFPNVYEFDFIAVDNRNYIYVLEEYIEGTTLREFIVNYCPNSEMNEIIDIGNSILVGLEKIHSNNLVHRDIKPENIILDHSKKKTYILDFGIVRDLTQDSLTADLAIFGPMTIGYAAPEQIQNKKKIICNRTDLFSWGIIMYEMIKGENPFKVNANSNEAILHNTLVLDVPELATTNANLNYIINKCLEKSVHRRPATARQVMNLLY